MKLNKIKSMELIIAFCFISIFLIESVPVAYGLLNPAFVYCQALGYENIATSTEQGNMNYCKLSNGESVDAWQFLEGKVAQDFSYCKKMGYGIKTVTDSSTCQVLFTSECAVCILPNSTEIEVTKLMNLSFREGRCGDLTCVIGENYFNCPRDCSSGSLDGICDKVNDGICDPDCERLNMKDQDIDCTITTTTITTIQSSTTTLPIKPSSSIYIYIVLIAVIILVIAFLFYKIRVVG